MDRRLATLARVVYPGTENHEEPLLMKSPRLFRSLPILVLLTAGPATAAASPSLPRLEVVPPPILSTAEPNPVRIVVETPEGGEALLSLEVRDGEGRRAALGQRSLSLPPGFVVVEWEVEPETLASFTIPSDLTLHASLRLPSGWSADADGEATLALAAEAVAGGWSVFFSTHPLLVYTQGPSSLPLAVFNPQSAARQGEVSVKFLDGRSRKAVRAGSLSLRLEPGWNNVAFPVPPSVTASALARGDVQAKAVLRVGGVLRARDFAPLDYDLALTASAAPSEGEAPLRVHLSAGAAGGVSPYAFTWAFGDGEEGSGPEADHDYARPGSYLATATVTDGLGGRVSASHPVLVRVSPLSVSCEAVPSEGPYPLSVAFDASASGGYGSYDYAWSFGDGGTSLERSPHHTYTAPGTYTATVTVLSGSLRETCSRSVVVSLPSFAVRASAGPGGRVSPAGETLVPEGGDLTVTVTPEPGYHIADVLVDGVSAGPVSSYTFTGVRANHTLEARFAETTYTITASAGPGGSVSPAGTVVLPVTERLEVRILPAARFRILDVRVDGVSVGPFPSVLLSGPSDHTLEAFFERTHHLVTATAGPGGTLSPSGEVEVPVGGTQTFTWSADPGHHLAELVVDGTSVGTPPSYTFTNVQADHTVEARFARNTFTIYTTFTPGGTVLPNGNVTVFEGEDRTFTITPNPGFVTKELVVDGVSIGPSRSHTFLAVDRDHYLHVVFEATTPRTFQITTLAGPGGSISPSGLVLVGEGSDVTFTVTPDPGFHTADVLVDGLSVGPVSSYTFTGVQADHTFAAFFAPDANEPPSITGLAADPETVPAGTGTSTLTFTLTDPEGGTVTWTATLSGSTSTGDLGTRIPSGGTVDSGSTVTVIYSAEKAGTGTVTVTIQAHDAQGATAAPQSVTLTLL